MPRSVHLLFVLALAPVRWAAAQEGRVRLEVVLSDTIGPSGTRNPVVRTPGILQDVRWREALQSSFPLRMRFRVEIWRVRTDWFDALERAFEWETVVEYEPLADQYSRTAIWGGSPRQFERLATLQDLERRLEADNRITIAPTGIGEYYFTVTLQIRILTDAEMEDLERFLQGEPVDRERPNAPGNFIERTTRRLLLRFGGLPYQELEAKSARFQVGRPGREEQQP